MRHRSRGFTLVEIAIVLVIIGLLMIAVIKGQELIFSARVRNVIAQQEGVKIAVLGFQDRYRALPGDYATASTDINCGATQCANGNGNGLVEAPNASGAWESILSWHHLSAAGFLTGSYAMASSATSLPDDGNTPRNVYGVYLQFAYDGVYGAGTTGAPSPRKHNLKTGTFIPVGIMAEVDRKIDDGDPFKGQLQFSFYAPAGFATPSATGCTTTTAAAGFWKISGGDSNCGGTSIF